MMEFLEIMAIIFGVSAVMLIGIGATSMLCVKALEMIHVRLWP